MYEIVVGRTEADKKALGLKGTVFLGKHYVRMGPTTSLSNKVYMDVTKSHVILISGKRGCLTPDTKILTSSGYKEIKNFNKLKDSILTYNVETREFHYSNAALLRYRINEKVIKLALEDGTFIETTEEHPLLVLENNKTRWKYTQDLKEGDTIIGFSKGSTNHKKISSISKIDVANEVYDLTVPITHSFIANGVISHNSGKSYLLGVIAEEMAHLPPEVKSKIAVLMFDTMGIFWTMRYENIKDEELLDQWQLPKKPLDINIYVPSGYFKEYKDKGIPADYSFTLNPSELNTTDWCTTFEISPLEPIGILIENTLSELRKNLANYDIEDIIETINKNKKADEKTKSASENLFSAAKSWGIFSKNATPLKEIFEGGKVSVLDISAYKEWNVKNLVIGLICKKLMQERMIARKKEELEDVQRGHSYFETTIEATGEEMPLVWMLLDESHESIGKEKTPATDALVQILREGRQPGISLILATQQPGEIHQDVITQTDIVISLRVTAKRDLEALNEMMQSYLYGEIQKYFNLLPKMRGAAIVLDDNSEKIYPVQIRPRFTWHGGEAPTALKAKGSAAEQLGL